jgi:uncharacterized protein
MRYSAPVTRRSKASTVLAIGLLLAGCSGGTTPPDASSPRGKSRSGGTTTEARQSTARVEKAPADAARPSPEAQGPTVVLHAIEGEVVVRVEVVKKREERSRGLMFRQHMAEDAGMLFLFRESEHQAFWMRNTYIPLDMLFIGTDYRVVGVVENATPRTDGTREVDGDSKYVLEVNAGFARRHGIGPGTLADFRGVDESGADP